MPEPNEGEDRQDFINRCMADGEARSDFPDQAQRFKFCESQWERKGVQKLGDEELTKDDMPRTLYISRPVLNADEIITWAKGQGFKTTYQPEDLHVTIAFSRRPVDWFALPDARPHIVIPPGGPRIVERLGDQGAVVVRFKSPVLHARHEQILEHGASWDYPGYKPHFTITLDAGDLDLSEVEPYQGEIVLGMEKFGEVRDDWTDDVTEKFNLVGEITKVEKDQMIAYGWFSVIEENGDAVVDSHGDVIMEKDLVQAAHNYITDSRAGKVMHKGRRVADIVDSIVLTKDVQKALGIDLGKVGWFGAMKFRDEKIWKAVKSGKLNSFSIGGFGKRTQI